MTEPISHRGPSQTLPDIFVAYNHYRYGDSSTGSFHQWGISLTLSGGRTLITNGSEIFEREGDFLVSRPHSHMVWRACGAEPVDNRRPRTRGSDSGWETIYAAFHPRPHSIPWLEALNYTDGIAVLHVDREPFRELSNAARELYDTYDKHHSLRDDWSLLALERLLMVLRSYLNRQQIAKDPRVQALVEAIHAGLSTPISGPELARGAGISVARMTTIFKAAMGTTPGEYIERVRLEIAADKLSRSPASVRAIALACGYTDANYFARRFRAHYGQSPSEYRQASSSPVTQG